MAPPPLAPAGGHPAARRSASHRGGKAALLVLAVVSASVVFYVSSAGFAFVAGRSTVRLPGATQRQLTQRRAGGYAFELAQSDEHTNLEVKETEEGAFRVFTSGSFMQGNYNTVLGNKELPATGRSYWEVKIVNKPTEAWEYIGVAEPTADVTVPLPRNRKGAGWFWGSTWTDSFIYTYLPSTPAFIEGQKKKVEDWVRWQIELFNVPEKDAKDDEFYAEMRELWKVGTHVGMIEDSYPVFESGMVIGVDVDMDDGSMAFWADGKYLGLVRDTTGKPVNLKGKKVVPALTIYGRRSSKGTEFTVMEVTTGLDPPPRP